MNNQSNTERLMRNENKIDKNSKVNRSMDHGEAFQGNRTRGISEGSRHSSVASNRSCSHYVPEKVQIFNSQMKQTHQTVKELISLQKEFLEISELTFEQRRDHF